MTSTATPPTSPATTATPTWLPLTAVAVTLVFWASAFVAIRHLGEDFSPGALSLGRTARRRRSASAWSRSPARASRARPGAQWVSLVTIGVLWFGVYNVALNAGERRVDAGTAAMLIQVSPVLIAVLAAVFLDERFTVYLGLGLALAFTGVGLISLSSVRDVQRPRRDRRAALPGLGGRLLDQPDPAEAARRQAAGDPRDLAGLHDRRDRLPAVRSASWSTRPATRPTSSVLWVVYLGVFPTAIAFTTYAFALEPHERQQPRRHDLPGPADHDRDGRGLPRRGAARDGVRRRRARPGRRGRRPAQAAHRRRRTPQPPARA